MKKFEIKQEAIVGTLESSDIQITIAPNNEEGIALEIISSVKHQYGAQIERVVRETLKTFNIEQAKLKLVDQGALDCTIEARLAAAIHRASGNESQIDWKELEQWHV